MHIRNNTELDYIQSANKSQLQIIEEINHANSNPNHGRSTTNIRSVVKHNQYVSKVSNSALSETYMPMSTISKVPQ